MRRTLKWALLAGALTLVTLAVLHYRYYFADVVCDIYQRERIKPYQAQADEILARGDADEIHLLYYSLQKRHWRVRNHEEAHRAAAGEWARRVQYFHVTVRGARYIIGGCTTYHPGIPRTVALRAALAPAEPSRQDLISARVIRASLALREGRLGEAAGEAAGALTNIATLVREEIAHFASD